MSQSTSLINTQTLSYNDLLHADHHLSAPFLLDIDENLDRWVCTKVLRVLPQKRLVLLIEKDDNVAVLKLFFREKDYQREIQGQQALIDNNLPCVKILNHIDNSYWHFITFEYIDAPSLGLLWSQAVGTEHKLQYLEQAIPTIARMHCAGLRQMDIHLDNFLVHHPATVASDKPQQNTPLSDDGLIIIDYADIRISDKHVGNNLASANLALLIAQLPGDYSPYYDRLLTCYHQYSGLDFTSAELSEKIAQMRSFRWAHYAKKITRDCSEFSVESVDAGQLVRRRDHSSQGLQELYDDFDFAIKEGKSLKNGNTATVALTHADHKQLVIKRYNIKNFFHAISRAFRPTRAYISWRNGYKLRFEGIQTPLPIALLQHKHGPFNGRAYLLCEHIDGKDLWQIYNEGQSCPIDRDILEQQIVDLFNNLLTAKISHGDLKGTNLIVSKDGLHVIDLDAMQIDQEPGKLKAALAKDLQRFLRNFDDSTRQRFEHLLADFNKKLA